MILLVVSQVLSLFRISLVVMESSQRDNRLSRWENKHIVKDTVLNSHHWGTALILASQFMLIQRSCLRSQFSYVFIFAAGFRGNKKRLHFAYQYYLGGIISREVFKQVMDSLDDHQALVVDNTKGKVYCI